MIVLIVGLVVFLGIHLSRALVPDLRERVIARAGEGSWKLGYSAASAVGLALIAWGYGLSRLDPVVLWQPPVWTRHLAITLNLVAFVLLAFYILPSGRVKARLGHPMLLAVKTWAVAHLIANGTLADVLLFGSFLVWAVVDFASNKRRDRRAGIVRMPGPVRNDAIAVALGALLWVVMLWRLHLWLIGVSPLA